jgi:hypothetical protein
MTGSLIVVQVATTAASSKPTRTLSVAAGPTAGADEPGGSGAVVVSSARAVGPALPQDTISSAKQAIEVPARACCHRWSESALRLTTPTYGMSDFLAKPNTVLAAAEQRVDRYR